VTLNVGGKGEDHHEREDSPIRGKFRGGRKKKLSVGEDESFRRDGNVFFPTEGNGNQKEERVVTKWGERLS